MTFVVKIDCDNAAFADDRKTEIRSLLSEVCRDLSRLRRPGDSIALRDRSGKTVCHAEFVTEARRPTGASGEPGRLFTRRIYVAGPLTKPDPVVNTRKAIEAGDALMQRGYAVFIPHLTLFWHLVVPHPWEIWLEHDIEWLSACDAVLLLPGESRGAERECAEAARLGIPVYRRFEDLTREMPANRTSGSAT